MPLLEPVSLHLVRDNVDDDANIAFFIIITVRWHFQDEFKMLCSGEKNEG